VKVLLVHLTDQGRGGGLIAMSRLHHGLKEAGVDSKILCHTKTLESSESLPIPRPLVVKILEGGLRRVTSRFGLNDLHCIGSFLIRYLDAYREADILHFHCMHGGFFNYLALPGLTANKPTVITHHDMWNFTGHCAYSYGCDRWKIGCGECPYPDTYPRIQRDNTHLEWKLKRWVYGRSNLTMIIPSTWLRQLAEQSMLRNFPIYQIPNGVDTDMFCPLDSRECRSRFGIPPRKKVLMFSAMTMDVSKSSGLRKGGDLLMKALQTLPEAVKSDTVLLLMGDKGKGIAKSVGIETFDLGYVSDDDLKAAAYSAADLFVYPTRADNMPLGLLESMACGTPMVSFKVGGVPDLVRPGITGYLAEPENTEDLSRGIVQLLEDRSLRKQMGRRCREIALKEYSLDRYIRRHVDLYRHILHEPQANLQPVKIHPKRATEIQAANLG